MEEWNREVRSAEGRGGRSPNRRRQQWGRPRGPAGPVRGRRQAGQAKRPPGLASPTSRPAMEGIPRNGPDRGVGPDPVRGPSSNAGSSRSGPYPLHNAELRSAQRFRRRARHKRSMPADQATVVSDRVSYELQGQSPLREPPRFGITLYSHYRRRPAQVNTRKCISAGNERPAFAR